MAEPWLSADDIATHLGVTKDTVYAWIADNGMTPHLMVDASRPGVQVPAFAVNEGLSTARCQPRRERHRLSSRRSRNGAR